MKKGEYISRGVLCPFYRKEDCNGIHCEGIEDDTTIKLIHQSSEAKKQHRRYYCSRGYKKCPIAIMLYKTYGEDV